MELNTNTTTQNVPAHSTLRRDLLIKPLLTQHTFQLDSGGWKPLWDHPIQDSFGSLSPGLKCLGKVWVFIMVGFGKL